MNMSLLLLIFLTRKQNHLLSIDLSTIMGLLCHKNLLRLWILILWIRLFSCKNPRKYLDSHLEAISGWGKILLFAESLCKMVAIHVLYSRFLGEKQLCAFTLTLSFCPEILDALTTSLQHAVTFPLSLLSPLLLATSDHRSLSHSMKSDCFYLYLWGRIWSRWLSVHPLNSLSDLGKSGASFLKSLSTWQIKVCQTLCP